MSMIVIPEICGEVFFYYFFIEKKYNSLQLPVYLDSVSIINKTECTSKAMRFVNREGALESDRLDYEFQFKHLVTE